MISRVLVDTSAWYALAAEDDDHHDEATRILGALLAGGAALLVTNHIVSETYTFLGRRLGLPAAHDFLRRAQASAYIERIHVPEEWEAAAEDLLLQFSDQPFSYVDATSFVTMRRLSLTEAFAFDRHFSTAGCVQSSEVR